MASFAYPASKLCRVGASNNFFLAVTGTHIQTVSLAQRQPVHIWPSEGDDTASEDEQPEGEVRPSKRVKLDNGSALNREASQGSDVSIEFKLEGKARQKGERKWPKIPDISLPHVSHVITTSDGLHAIAVTSDDKSVRVFRVSKSGRLRQLSCRTMPKKCCAITLSPDEKSILTADKFGDVYAIPLLPSSDYKPRPKASAPETTYKPSATELTVHTKGNRDALRQQLNQKQKHVRKEGPEFEHLLLLGHVSLLTDLCTASGEVDGRQRPFIITADRDEHIRVSRGMPQTHIIQSYCLGHTEFVSKLCIVPWQPQLLLAGNGEPSLRLFDWQRGVEMLCFNFIEEGIDAHIKQSLASDRTVDKTAVSGIWPIPNMDFTGGTLLVAFEGVPRLLTLRLQEKNSKWHISHCDTMKLKGNLLDLIYFPEQKLLAVGIDTIHEPGSYKAFRTCEESTGLEFFEIDEAGVLSGVTGLDITVDHIPADKVLANAKSEVESQNKGKSWEKIFTPLGELIYGLENLRKRRGRAAEDEEEEEGDAEEILEVNEVTAAEAQATS